MNAPDKLRIKISIGILIGLICLYLALRRIDFDQMLEAFQTIHYGFLIPAVLVVLFSHLLRSLRWRFLLDPVKRVDTGSLFSSLMIGYTANAFIPAHLGEFLRAYVLSRKREISMSSVFATIVTERLIDVFSLLALFLLAIFMYPFPDWINKSGYIMLAASIGLFVFLILLKVATSKMMRILYFVLKSLPDKFEGKIESTIENFIAGLVPLRKVLDYIFVVILSVSIWCCYGIVFHLTLLSFDFINTFGLNWTASLILLVITTIAVVVPSSPGYVGTYHYLCQVSLAMFQIPAGPALSFGAVVHAVNLLPVVTLGLIFAQIEGAKIFQTSIKPSKNSLKATDF
jgi:uncharacterized protein (TIRG00374 family)